MSSTLNVASSPKAWAVRTNTSADTSFTAPTNTATLIGVTASDVKVDRIRVCQVKTTTAAGIINFFLVDLSAGIHRHGSLAYGTGTVSTTLVPQPKEFTFDSLEVPAGWSLIVTNTVASSTDAAGFEILAFGGAY